jgi:hypothetical protein
VIHSIFSLNLESYPILLNPTWQSEQVREMKAIYGEERVLIGKAGFTSLVNPHRVTVP